MALPLSPELRAKIAAAYPSMLAGVARGDKVSDVVAAAGIIHENLRAFWSNVPGARQEWDDARRESSYALDEIARGIVDTEKMDPADKRVRSDYYRWAAAKRNPVVYSDKVQHDHTVKHIDLTRIIEAASARLAAVRVTPNSHGALEHRAPALPALPVLEAELVPEVKLADLL
jgi:hypothetical protein